jgi:hypothetical protein
VTGEVDMDNSAIGFMVWKVATMVGDDEGE